MGMRSGAASPTPSAAPSPHPRQDAEDARGGGHGDYGRGDGGRGYGGHADYSRGDYGRGGYGRGYDEHRGYERAGYWGHPVGGFFFVPPPSYFIGADYFGFYDGCHSHWRWDGYAGRSVRVEACY